MSGRTINQAAIQDQRQLEDLLKDLRDGDLSADYMRVASVDLDSGDANDFAFTWQNPEDKAIVVHRVLVDVTTAGGTGSSVLDVGTASAATGTDDNLIDGADLNATAVYDNIDDQGTNGESKARLDENGGTTDWVTGKILVANAASLVGQVRIFYSIIES